MKWPWVSRREYDSKCRDYDRLLDHTLTIQRREAGMPEVPRALAPIEQSFEIPDDIVEMLEDWPEGVRVVLRQQMQMRIASGTTWDLLRSELIRQTGTDDEVTH